MRVIHLIPRDGLGGVESAARSFAATDNVDIQVWFMAGESLLKADSIRVVSTKAKLNSIAVYWNTLVQLLAADPEVLVVSLWRARLVGLIYKALRPRVKLVAMIHSTRFTHVVDKWVTCMSVWLAVQVWFDSHATMQAFPRLAPDKTRVVSFLVRVPESPVVSRTLDFVYWGRLAKVKAVSRAIKIFDRVKQEFPIGRFLIYGPDDGDLDAVVEAIARSSDPGAIVLAGKKPAAMFPDPIPKCSFFLMTSNAEGMAISVIEAMQLGLVPIVTPVGEIPRYCFDGRNAVLIHDDDVAVAEIVSILKSPARLLAMQEASAGFWRDRPDYGSDFRAACLDLLAIP